MTCPHLADGVCGLTTARMTAAGCEYCQSEWTAGPPNDNTLTPFLLDIAIAVPTTEQRQQLIEQREYNIAMGRAGLRKGCGGCG